MKNEYKISVILYLYLEFMELNKPYYKKKNIKKQLKVKLHCSLKIREWKNIHHANGCQKTPRINNNYIRQNRL